MSTTDAYLRIAKITGAHGLHGRLKIFVISDLIERFDPGNAVYIHYGSSYKEHRVRAFQHQKGRTALLELEGIDGIDEALTLKNSEIFILREKAEKSRADLEGNAFYYYDIIGCTVFLEGSIFGTVSDIFEAGAGDILVITDKEGKEVLVPFVGSMVNTEEVRQGKIVITPVEGLLE